MDRDALKGVFQAGLDGFSDGRLRLEGLKVMRFAYQPAEQCSLSYELRVTEPATGRQGIQNVFAVVALDGAAEARFAAATRRARLESWVGSGEAEGRRPRVTPLI